MLAEEKLMYGLLGDKKLAEIIFDELKEDDFYQTEFKKIYRASLGLFLEGKTFNPINFAEKYKIELYRIAELSNTYVSEPATRECIAIVKEASQKRKLEGILNTTKTLLPSQSSNQLSDELINKVVNLTSKTEETSNILPLMKEFELIQETNAIRFKNGDKLLGFSCGFPSIDDAISGIREGHYWTIVAYTSSAKSFFAINIALKALEQGKRVLFFSLEMTKHDIIARMLGIKSGIHSNRIISGSLAEYELDKETTAKGELSNSDLQIYGNKSYMDEIERIIIGQNSIKKVDLVVLDYIQHIRGKERSQYDNLSEASRRLQDIALRLNTSVICLSQTDNQSAREKKSSIIATKGSGDIAGDADFIIMLQRQAVSEERYEVKKELPIKAIIQKNRHGSLSIVDLFLNLRNGRIQEEHSNLNR